jgi:hypothetical protein
MHNAMCFITRQSKLTLAEADRLYSFHLRNALEDDRRHTEEAVEAKLRQEEDQIVWRLLKEFHDGDARAGIESSSLPETGQILSQYSGLDKQEAQRLMEN